MAIGLLSSGETMQHVDEAIAIEGIRSFLKLHATCGHAAVDTPELPGGTGCRVVAACRCGETMEYWVTSALFPQSLVSAALGDPPSPTPRRTRRAA